MRKIRILVLVQFLSGGGAARVFSLVLCHLDPERFEIHLGVVSPNRPESSPLPPHITVHRLGLRRVRYAVPAVARLVRTIRPQVVLSGSSHLSQLLVLLKPVLPRKTRIVARLETTPSQLPHTRITRILYRFVYRGADAIICQSPAMARDMSHHFGHPLEKLPVLRNPLDLHNLLTSPAANTPWPPGPGPNILAIGRLSPEKGFDQLIHALPSLRAAYPHIRLALLGSGPQQQELRALTRQLDLEGLVLFPGHVSSPQSYFAQATLFALSSSREGMPNAMLEAAAADLPLVVTPCSSGVTELLANRPGVWFSQDSSSNAIADALQRALASVFEPGHAPARFNHTFLDPFHLPTAINAWQNLLTDIAVQGHP